MFAYYGIEVTRAELIKLFNLIDKDRSGDLNFNEFKAFACNPDAN